MRKSGWFKKLLDRIAPTKNILMEKREAKRTIATKVVANTIIRYGGINGICPGCQQETPVYKWSTKGSNSSTRCVHCEASLQWDKEQLTKSILEK